MEPAKLAKIVVLQEHIREPMAFGNAKAATLVVPLVQQGEQPIA